MGWVEGVGGGGGGVERERGFLGGGLGGELSAGDCGGCRLLGGPTDSPLSALWSRSLRQKMKNIRIKIRGENVKNKYRKENKLG